MKVNIISKEQNPLMKRKEVKFSVDHSMNGGTPSRAEVSKQLASILSVKSELIFVKNMATKRGSAEAVGEANVYDTMEQAKLLEPKHIIARNIVAAPEKPKEPEKAEEAEESQSQEEESSEEKEESSEES